MELEAVEVIVLELKYCEGCGSLWFRPLGSEEVYCAPCLVRIAEFTPPHRKVSRPQLPGNHKTDLRGQGADLSSICVEGGHA
jgi:hypothetical protein